MEVQEEGDGAEQGTTVLGQSKPPWGSCAESLRGRTGAWLVGPLLEAEAQWKWGGKQRPVTPGFEGIEVLL